MSWLDVDWTSCYFVELFPSIFRLDGSFSSMNRAQKLVWTIVPIIQTSSDIYRYLFTCMFLFPHFFWVIYNVLFLFGGVFSWWFAYCKPNPHTASSVGTTSYCPATLVAASFGGVKWASSWGIQKQNMHGILSILPVYIHVNIFYI